MDIENKDSIENKDGIENKEVNENAERNDNASGKTFTEDEVNKIIKERLSKEKNRIVAGLGDDFSSIKDVKTAMDELRKAKEEIEIAKEKIETEYKALEIENAKILVSIEKNIPANFARFITGTTTEEVKQSADEIVQNFGEYFNPKKTQVTTNEKQMQTDKNDLAGILKQRIEEARK